LRLPSFDVPRRDAAAAPAGVTLSNCPVPGGLFSLVLALPNGSAIALLSTVWSAGTASVDLTVPAPQPQELGADTTNSNSPSAQLPSTGAASRGSGLFPWPFALALTLAAVGFLIASVPLVRRSR
jgi:hypothetical protein